MKNFSRAFASFLLFGVLTAGAALAEPAGAARYDSAIETRVNQALSKKQEFRSLQASVEDGIVTLTGDVNLYQQKLDAAKKVRKLDKVQGVRNLIAVGSTVPDAQLAAQLDRKLYYDRVGYDNLFNYVTVSVNDGVVTLIGDVRNPVSRNSAFAIAGSMPGVKEVVDNIKVLPASPFDDQIRLRATRAIYGNSVLSRYAIDPARPIRIVVDNGKLTLYGTVQSKMDKQIAGIQAGQVFGVFSVQNNLAVASKS
jgi:osmotically-inducible protein OsmY